MKTYRARIVLTMAGPPIEDGLVQVADGRIVAVGRRETVSAHDVEDLGEVVLMPGLINAHCHLDYTAMRGAIRGHADFPDWIRRLNELKRALTDDDFLASIAEGFSTLCRSGTTSVFNIESFPELMVRMPAPPIRTWWFYEMLDIRKRVHTEDVVAGALTFFERRPAWFGGFGLSPHAPYTTSTELYESARLCCEKYSMPWVTHLAESEEELEMFLKASGPLHHFLASLGRNMSDTGCITPVGKLFSHDLVPRGGMLVHMNCLTESDFALLADRAADVTIVHCPNCHAYFRRPPFELDRLRALGIRICLGTDSLASNSSLDLFAEMRIVRQEFPALRPTEILEMVTRSPAAAIGEAGTLGEIVPGAHADLIAVPWNGPVADATEGVIEHRGDVPWRKVAGRQPGGFTKTQRI